MTWPQELAVEAASVRISGGIGWSRSYYVASSWIFALQQISDTYRNVYVYIYIYIHIYIYTDIMIYHTLLTITVYIYIYKILI